MKTCSCKTCKNPILPATPEYFSRVKKYKDGLDSWCKGCQNARKKELRGLAGNKLLIDFSQCPEVLESLKGLANCEERTVEAQVRYMLKTDTADVCNEQTF